MLNVGVIGLGPDWEHRYRPAFVNLQQRIKVRAVYNPVASLADQAAVELQTQPAYGLRSMLRRRDLRAIVLLDAGWLKTWPWRWTLERGRSLYLSAGSQWTLPELNELAQQARDLELTLMPELPHRHTASTSRFRELMATRLGRPQKLKIEAVLCSGDEQPGTRRPALGLEPAVDLLDWCRYLAGTSVRTVRGFPVENGVQRIELEFRRAAAGGDPLQAEVTIRSPLVIKAGSGVGYRFRCEAQMTRGSAVIEGDRDVVWQVGDHCVGEHLDAERSEAEVVLDHFSRRVVGGLIPVATLDDVLTAQRLLELARDTATSGKPIEVSEDLLNG